MFNTNCYFNESFYPLGMNVAKPRKQPPGMKIPAMLLQVQGDKKILMKYRGAKFSFGLHHIRAWEIRQTPPIEKVDASQFDALQHLD